MPDPIPPKLKPPVTPLWESIRFWKLAILKVSLMAVVAFCVSWQSSLSGAEWDNFNFTEKIVAWLSAIQQVALVLIAFLSDTMAKLTEEKKAIDSGAVTVTETTSTTTTDSTIPSPTVPPTNP